MKTITSTTYRYQPETAKAAEIIKDGTICAQSHAMGIRECEPLIVILDSAIRYAKAYATRFEQPLSDDGVLSAPWLEIVKGARALLNGDGAAAYEIGRTTDSKDNGACESMFWEALKIAGFSESDL